MLNTSQQSLEFLFHPRSIALVGITTANPEHWTRTFLDGLLEFGFEGQMYLVNPKGGQIKGRIVHTSIQDISDTMDYAIGLVNAQAAPRLVEECAEKGVRAVHFCTAGFSETGEEEGIKLESELIEVAGTVVRTSLGNETTETPGMGIEFGELSATARQRINELIRHLRAAG